LANNHQIYYFTNQTESIFPFSKYTESVKIFDLGISSKKMIFRPLGELVCFFRLRRYYQEIASEINNSDIDVVLAHPCQQTQSPWVLRFMQKPTLYFIEETLRAYYESELHSLKHVPAYKSWYEHLKRRWIAQIDKRNLVAATKLMTSSHHVQSEVKRCYGRGSTVNHLGVDLEVFKFCNESNTKSQFLFIGEKEKINGYPLLQSALKLMESEIEIKYVTFCDSGFSLNEKELVGLYQNSVATLCLSQSEPFGLVALESMACKTPVIAVNEGGYQETVVHQKTGLLIKRKPQELAEAMELLASDAKLRSRLGKNGFLRVKKYFNWSLHAQNLEKELLLLRND